MDKLFDESILIGSGYTARETLRYDVEPVISGLFSARDRGSGHFVSISTSVDCWAFPLPLDLELREVSETP